LIYNGFINLQMFNQRSRRTAVRHRQLTGLHRRPARQCGHRGHCRISWESHYAIFKTLKIFMVATVRASWEIHYQCCHCLESGNIAWMTKLLFLNGNPHHRAHTTMPAPPCGPTIAFSFSAAAHTVRLDNGCANLTV
jgi:hypothetical protein